jgi:hypothetical protein
VIAVPVAKAVGVADQPHARTRRHGTGDARAEARVLPAHVRDVVDAGAGSGEVPVEERDRSQGVHELRVWRLRAPDGVANPDHDGHQPARQRLLVHASLRRTGYRSSSSYGTS